MGRDRKDTMSPREAGLILGKTPQLIRIALQQQRLPIGSAWQKPDGRWTYHIVTAKVNEYMGIKAS